ncbi:hypothetical protein PGB90_000467 [Kerria lacca]
MGSNKGGDNSSCKEKVRSEENEEEETMDEGRNIENDRRRRYKQTRDEEGIRKYRDLRNQVRKECRKAKEEWINQNCKEIEEKMKEGKIDKSLQ